jgi:hypothetical protein
LYSAFQEYRNHKIETLGSAVGKAFRCWYDPDGLPEKLLFWPDSQSDDLTDPPLRMMLVESGAGKKLEYYLEHALGLKKGEDYSMHSNGERGGTRYFDIESEKAVASLFARADELGAGLATSKAVEKDSSLPMR